YRSAMASAALSEGKPMSRCPGMEQSDPGRGRGAQAPRYGPRYGRPHRRDRSQEEKRSGPEHDAELDRVFDLWERFQDVLGPWKSRYLDTAESFLSCGIFEKGFSLFRCESCGHSLRVAFSCKTRLCPSCVRKRMTQWSDWLSQEVLLELPHRHWVFTLPQELRRHFVKKRWLLNKLSNTAARVLMRQMSVRCPEAFCVPGVIVVIQTAGDALTFNPHAHIIATTQCLGPSGRLHKVPYIPYVKLSRIWKSAVLYLLKNTKCITREEMDVLWKRYPNGFNLNGEIKDTVRDREASKRLSEYLVRPAMAEYRITNFNRESHTVRFKGRGAKDRKTGRRPRIIRSMDSVEFTARLLAQTPPKGQKLVNYYGIYSNKVRGMWKKVGFKLRRLKRKKQRHASKLGWRSQLWRIYEVDPLRCPDCLQDLTLIDLVFPPESSILAQPP
ncbi:transposase zinc-binding domain-containing protein, partial [Elusimicrobiota bacterium]